MAAIVADPEAVENWIVYADWLCARDDPRGELMIVLFASMEQDEAEVDDTLPVADPVVTEPFGNAFTEIAARLRRKNSEQA